MSNLIICGFRGAGKTTFGRQLAAQLNLPFLDVDDLIEKSAGEAIRPLFLRDKGKTFERIEKEVVTSLIGIRNHVIALGGATLCHPENRATLLQLGQLIYLKVDKEILRGRKDPVPFMDFDQAYAKRTTLFESLPVITLEGVTDG